MTLFFGVASLVLYVCAAELTHFQDLVMIKPGVNIIQTAPMYSPEDSPVVDGDGSSYFKLSKGMLDGTYIEAATVVEFFLVRGDAWAFFQTPMCCVHESLGRAQFCDAVDTLMIDRNSSQIYYSSQRTLTPAKPTIDNIDLTKAIQDTDLYSFVVSYCGVNAGPYFELTFDGYLKWRNPYGLLPGGLWGYLPFYGWMCVIYLSILIIWFVLNAVYWQEVVMLQNFITLVLALCVVEASTWYFDYYNFNNIGERPMGPFTIGIVFSALRRTVSRVLVICVGLGWGVVRPTLNQRSWIQILVLGTGYLIFDSIFDVYIKQKRWHGEDPPKGTMYILAVFDTAFNATIYWWIFLALYRTTTQLQAKGLDLKLQLYTRFARVLMVSVCVSVVCAMYQVYAVRNAEYWEHIWREQWLIEDGYPEIIYLCVLTSIAFLWRPSNNSQRYAYVRVAGEDLDVDEYGTLEQNGGATVSVGSPANGLRVNGSTKLEMAQDSASSLGINSSVRASNQKPAVPTHTDSSSDLPRFTIEEEHGNTSGPGKAKSSQFTDYLSELDPDVDTTVKLD